MGFLFVFLASFLFGAVPTVQDYVIGAGASPLGLVILCNGAATIAVGLTALLRRDSFRLNLRQLLSLLLTGGVGLFLTDLLLNTAYARIPVGLTTMLHFLYPTIVSLAMMVFFREKSSKTRAGAILLSFVGLFLLLGGNLSGNLPGMLAALASAVCYAFYIISNDRMSESGLPELVRVFYINLSSVLAAVLVACVSGRAAFPTSGGSVLLGALAGVLLCTGLVLLNAGIRRLGASRAAFFNTLEPITSLVVSSLAAHTVPTGLTILGSCLVLLSLALYAWGDRKKMRNEK